MHSSPRPHNEKPAQSAIATQTARSARTTASFGGFGSFGKCIATELRRVEGTFASSSPKMASRGPNRADVSDVCLSHVLNKAKE